MKIEMCPETTVAVCWVSSCLTIAFVLFFVYRYNALVYEKGYVQKQGQGTPVYYWTKE